MNRNSAYETYKNGQWTLMGVSAVTAVNIVLAAFSLKLFFPFSAYSARELILRGGNAGGSWFWLSVAAAVVLLFCFLGCYISSLGNDKFPAMRFGMILYALDTAVYFVLALPSIAESGFGISHIIEFVFRWFIIMTLYKADKVFYDPKRKNPNAKPNRLMRKKQPEEPAEDREEEEDEGIQW